MVARVEIGLEAQKMTPAQLRAARSFLQMTVDTLAEAAKVAPNTISRFEREEGALRRSTADVLERALASKGIELTGDGGIRPRMLQAG